MKLGKYRHYKGGMYKVIGVGRHTETDKVYVIYKALYGTRKERKKLHIRPYDMFEAWGMFNGKRQFRFVKVPNILTRLYCWWNDLHWY